MVIFNDIEIPDGLGNFYGTEPGDIFDLILFNLATKKAYLYRNLFDAGTPNAVQINRFDIGEVPTGEYEYALLKNTRGYLEYTFKNSLLDTVVSLDGTEYSLFDLNPDLGLLKYIGEDTGEEPEYRDTEKEFYYRKK